MSLSFSRRESGRRRTGGISVRYIPARVTRVRIIKDRIRGRSSELCGASVPDSLSPVWVNAGNVMLRRTSSPFLL